MDVNKQQQKAGDNANQLQVNDLKYVRVTSDSIYLVNNNDVVNDRNVIIICEQVVSNRIPRLKVRNDGNLAARNVNMQILDSCPVCMLVSLLDCIQTTTISVLAPKEDRYYTIFVLTDFPTSIRIRFEWDDEHKLNNEKIITVRVWNPDTKK